MSLLEFLGETFSPGDMAHPETDEPATRKRPRNFIVLIFGISAVTVVITSLVYIVLYSTSMIGLFLYIIFLILYLLVAYRFKLNIPMNNIGIFGLPIDNPFRISDDFNRLAIVIAILFVPGKIISVWLANFLYLLKRYWRMRKFIHLKH